MWIEVAECLGRVLPALMPHLQSTALQSALGGTEATAVTDKPSTTMASPAVSMDSIEKLLFLSEICSPGSVSSISDLS